MSSRNLHTDLRWLMEQQHLTDLSDEYLKKKQCDTRADYANKACDFSYGITFVESSIAREWLERAIRAEEYNEYD